MPEFEFPDPMEPKVFMDEFGREVPNPEPIVIYLPSGPVTEFDRVREIIRRELSLQMSEQGMETEEDANDFDVDGDIFPVSPHEYSEATEAADQEAFQAEAERDYQAKKAAKAKKAKARQAEPDEPPGDPKGVADPLDDAE